MKNAIIYLLSLLFFAISCKNEAENSAINQTALVSNFVTLSDSQLLNTTLSFTQVQENELTTFVKLNGKIEVPPQNLLSVSAPLGGYIKSIQWQPGSFVAKGQVLANIENIEFVQLQEDYLMAKSKYYYAQLNYQRQRDLNNSNASSDKVLQEAQAEMEANQILMNSLSEKLKLIHISAANLTANTISKSIPITAGISGYVTKVNVKTGMYVDATEVLFEIVNTSTVNLVLNVYEKDLNSIKVGDKLLAYSNQDLTQKYPCKVLLINQSLEEDGVSELRCAFLNKDANLKPGMYMNADVEIQSAVLNCLPVEALVNFEGNDYVFIQQNGEQVYEFYKIEKGKSNAQFVEVINSEYLQGKNIVLEGAYTLLMKMKNVEE